MCATDMRVSDDGKMLDALPPKNFRTTLKSRLAGGVLCALTGITLAAGAAQRDPQANFDMGPPVTPEIVAAAAQGQLQQILLQALL